MQLGSAWPDESLFWSHGLQQVSSLPRTHLGALAHHAMPCRDDTPPHPHAALYPTPVRLSPALHPAAGSKHVGTRFEARDRKKYVPGCMVKSRNEPACITQVRPPCRSPLPLSVGLFGFPPCLPCMLLRAYCHYLLPLGCTWASPAREEMKQASFPTPPTHLFSCLCRTGAGGGGSLPGGSRSHPAAAAGRAGAGKHAAAVLPCRAATGVVE